MYERVLVALSREGRDAQLIEAAAAVAARGAQVCAVHVRDIDEPAEPGRRLVTDAVDDLRRRGVVARPQVHVASQASHKYADLIAAAAHEFGADLVVMGSRGLSDLTAVFRHSVSHQTLSRLDVPVLIVRGHEAAAHLARLARSGSVLVAVDGSEQAASLAGEVAAFAPRARTLVAHVLETAVTESFAYVEPQDEADAVVDHFVRALRSRGLRSTGTVLRSGRGVAHAVAEFAREREVDLVVMGSRRLGDLPGLLLGSVSHEVVHLHDGPVLIAGRRASGQLRTGAAQAVPAGVG
jgi:nucleotide-binding universal stress UspA family protein